MVTSGQPHRALGVARAFLSACCQTACLDAGSSPCESHRSLALLTGLIVSNSQWRKGALCADRRFAPHRAGQSVKTAFNRGAIPSSGRLVNKSGSFPGTSPGSPWSRSKANGAHTAEAHGRHKRHKCHFQICDTEGADTGKENLSLRTNDL